MTVAVISDVHGNLEALRAVLEDAGPVDAVWCLGDTVGYGPRPEACVQAVRELPHVAVPGNHDWAAIGRIGVEDFNPDAATAARWTSTQLTEDVKDYLRRLPQRRVEGEFTLVHGSPRSPIWEYLLSARVARENFPHFQTRYCLVGHTHIPSYFRLRDDQVEAEYVPGDSVADLTEDTRCIFNPGSVGQPRDDNPLAGYMLLDTERRTVTWRRVPYDIAETQRQMRDYGLPSRLIERLARGW